LRLAGLVGMGSIPILTIGFVVLFILPFLLQLLVFVRSSKKEHNMKKKYRCSVLFNNVMNLVANISAGALLA